MVRRWVLVCAVLSVQAHPFHTDVGEEAERAKSAMLSQRYAEAAEIYRRMAAELPSETGIRLNLALALHSLGRYRESTQTLESIRVAQKNNAKFWFLLGEGYLKLEEPQKAVGPLQHAAQLDSSNLDTSLELASAWLESNQFSKAADQYLRLSSQHPELPKVWAGLSLSQMELARRGPPEGAEAQSRLAEESAARLAALPESAEQHEMLAQIYSRSGRRNEAILELREANRLSPGNLRIQSTLARELVANREFDQASEILRRLLAANPDRSAWQFDLGDALLETGQTNEAIQHLKRAVELSPTLLAAQAKLGEALLSAGSPADAAAHLELAQSIDTDGSIHFQLASAYRRLGKGDLAAKAMARRAEILKSTKSPGR